MANPTIGELERKISQRVSSLYNEKIGRRPSQIICHFFDSELVISLEDSVTQIEKTLLESGHESLAEHIRTLLDKIIKHQLKIIIEEVINKPIIDLMNNTNLVTGRTGIVVILDQLPEVRNPESIPKVNWKNLAD
ncbi:hypothetical protein NIES2111_23960 [Nostoc sp. NIES-2111]|uniref:DUF2294 domain-containing protein n=1 Tax=Nostoc sp. NIES-3756 TaxID=1751286 RepID=UPI000832F9E7|nr:DUF2294 domain-containing protein [Nostoc sp. NIES-3756]BAY38052.1 hypothetical protein NIES2111_23960 [Nostoc sp. NIES-2111]